MNKLIVPEDIIEVVKSFISCNDGDESTECLILAIGAEILDISVDAMSELI